jgi:cobalt-zinc-cadmium efflux system membrane fusion protein
MSPRALVGVLGVLALLGCGDKEAPHEEAEHDDGTEHHDEGDEEGAVQLSPEQTRAAGITTARVEVRRETAVLEANGQIEPAADREARIGARVPGRITKLQANVGDVVKKGQTLAVVESPELGRAKADFIAARMTAQVARETADREKQLFDRKISSEKEWRNAEADAIRAEAEKEAAENRLHALGVSDAQLPGKVEHFTSTISATTPIAGVVVERSVTLGETVDPEDTLFVVMDLEEVWILVDVFERDLAQASLGQKVTVSVAAYPEQEFKGEVSHIGSVIEPRSRAVKVRVVLANPDHRLKPGMFARVVLAGTRGEEHEHLFVPVAAVQRTEAGPIVFVPGREPGTYVARKVRTGHEVGESIAIESGLTAGETVVASGSFILKSELQKGSLGERGHGH